MKIIKKLFMGGLLFFFICSLLSSQNQKTLPELIKIISSNDSEYKEKQGSIRKLANMGQKAKMAIPALINLLDSYSLYNSSQAYYNVIESLIKIDPEDKKVIWILINHLFCENHEHLENISERALKKIGKKAVPYLIKSLFKKGLWENTIKKAIDILVYNDPRSEKTVLALIKLFSESEFLREHATKAFSKIGSEAVPSLILSLSNKNTKVLICTIKALGYIGPGAKKAIPALIDLLSNTNENIESAVIETLYKINISIQPNTRQIIPILINILSSSQDNKIKINIIKILGSFGSKAESAVPVLSNIFLNERGYIRISILKTLTQMGTKAEKTVPFIINVLLNQNTSNNFKLEAVDTLVTICPKARIVPAIVKIFLNKNLLSREYFAKKLGELGHEARNAIPVLITALSDEDESIRYSGAEAIGKIGIKDKKVVSKLLFSSFYDKYLSVRIAAGISLWKLGYSTDKVTHILINALSTKKGKAKIAAGQVLLKLGHKTEAISVFISTLFDNDFECRYHAAKILGEIGPESAIAVCSLIKIFRDNNRIFDKTRKMAAWALGEIGQKAKSAAFAFTKAIADKNETNDLKTVAIEALKKIFPEYAKEIALKENNQARLLELMNKIYRGEQQ